jgi:hypothetical protein
MAWMNLLESVLDARARPALGQIAKQVGLPESAVEQAVSAMLPALARGLQRNAGQPGGLESLLNALGTGNHQRYVDEPARLADPSATEEGNAILGHIFGSKDVSRNVAGAAARQTGISPDALKKMLPMVAAVAMGALSKETGEGAQLRTQGSPSAGRSAFSMLSGFLDADKDGDATDDLLKLARRFF